MKRYGLLGYPLGHSFSASFFAEKFKREGIAARYDNYERPSVEHLREWVEEAQLSGFNVTIPHKQAVISFLDAVTDDAKAIGAVNVVKVEEKDGKLFLRGYNSDVIGFANSLLPLLKEHHRKAFVLGTGGASRAVVYALEKLNIEVHLVSRRPQQGQYTYEMLTPELLSTHHLIVNCTPLGTYPNVDTCPALPYEALTAQHLLYDLVYNPEETLFLSKGREQGAVTKNGYEMLILQAEAAWQFWQE